MGQERAGHLKVKKLLRQVHYWASPVIMLPLGLVVVTGLLLMLKKDIGWIQPPTQRGVAPGVPSQEFGDLFAAAQGVPELALESWRDLDRVDLKPDKGVVKFVAANRWEAQIDAETGEVLQVAYRRSDLIESLHDGSFFSGWAKKGVFLPAGVVPLLLWGTGIYLFVLPYTRKKKKRGAVRERRSTGAEDPAPSLREPSRTPQSRKPG
jgi:uncharacterized iron-regulated membrane protein